jgi:gliding motility-associated-like protein
LKNRSKHIILSVILIIFSYYGHSQNGDHVKDSVVCYGDYAYYEVTDTSVFSSVLTWNIEGNSGQIIENYGNKVLVHWNADADTGKLTVFETGLGGCIGDTIKKYVNYSRPSVELADREICLGGVAEFETEDDYSSYLWPDSSQGETYALDSSGRVWVRVKDEFGCDASDTAQLTVHDLPEVNISVTSNYPESIDMGDDSISFIGGEVDMVTLDAGIWNWYEWNTGETMSTIDVLARNVGDATQDQNTKKFWVTVENEYGCRNSDSLAVTVIRKLKIPNAITPNGDGSNDKWRIPGLSLYPNAVVEIYDRWGDIVYRSNGYDESKYWDGRDRRGRELPMDSYYYVINLGNGEKPLYGSVTIIR